MKADGIIFDLDGTLWDATDNMAESWRNSLNKHYPAAHLPSTEAVKGVMGLPPLDIAEKLFANCGDDPLKVFHLCASEQCGYLAVHGGNLYPDLESTLSELSKNYSLFVVSNCDCGYIECFFENTGFSKYFTDYECAGNTGLPKCENIKIVAKRNCLKYPVYVGDTALDESSAKSANCSFIHAAYGFGKANNPDAVINSPAELLKTVTRN